MNETNPEDEVERAIVEMARKVAAAIGASTADVVKAIEDLRRHATPARASLEKLDEELRRFSISLREKFEAPHLVAKSKGPRPTCFDSDERERFNRQRSQPPPGTPLPLRRQNHRSQHR